MLARDLQAGSESPNIQECEISVSALAWLNLHIGILYRSPND